METQTNTIRLVYPQWQGGNIAQWITEVKDPDMASRGYYLGAQLLNFLAPDSGQETFVVPVSTDIMERKVTDDRQERKLLLSFCLRYEVFLLLPVQGLYAKFRLQYL